MSTEDDAALVAAAEATISGWADVVARGGRVELGLRRGQLVRLAAGCAILLVAEIGLLVLGRDASERFWGGAGVVVCGTCLAVFGWLLAQRGAAVVVDARHVSVPRRGLVIPWSAICDAMTVRVNRAEKVQLVVSPEFAREWYSGRSAVVRQLARVGRAYYAGTDALPLPFPLEGEPALVAEWLSRESDRRNPALR